CCWIRQAVIYPNLRLSLTRKRSRIVPCVLLQPNYYGKKYFDWSAMNYLMVVLYLLSTGKKTNRGFILLLVCWSSVNRIVQYYWVKRVCTSSVLPVKRAKTLIAWWISPFTSKYSSRYVAVGRTPKRSCASWATNNNVTPQSACTRGPSLCIAYH